MSGFDKPSYLLGQFGEPLYGVSSIPPFTGNYFFVNETTGSDGNTGGPQDPFKTLTQAHSFCQNNNNDVVFLTGTVHTTATTTWSKSRTHLIGLAPNLDSQARARISQTGSTLFTPLVNVTASECIIQNIGAFHGFADTSAQICWNDSGGRNQYKNCAFLGMANATGAAAQTGSRNLTVTGPNGECTFERCTIGLDTITRSAANASVEFLSGTPRNVLRQCNLNALTSSASALHLTVGADGIDRYALFERCTFFNSVDSGGTAMTVAAIVNASAGGSVLLQYCTSVGATVYATTGPIYVDGASAATFGATTGLAVHAT